MIQRAIFHTFVLILALLSIACTAQATSTVEKIPRKEGEVRLQNILPPMTEDPKFLAELAVAQSYRGQAGCQKRWDTLWQSAKKGSLYARQGLFWELSWGGSERPGANTDALSRTRDLAILSLYSLPPDDQKPTKNELELFSSAFGYFDGFKALLKNSKVHDPRGFFQCLEDKPSARCKDIALDLGYIPTFEDYTVEVDRDAASNPKVNCHLGHEVEPD